METLEHRQLLVADLDFISIPPPPSEDDAPTESLYSGLTSSLTSASSTSDWGWETIIDNGPVENRIDLVFVGDGYTEGELGLYTQQVTDIIAPFFQESPLDQYSSFFNVHRVDVISDESGVDNDGDDPVGEQRDTALDMRFWCSGTKRLLCINTGKATTAASAAPQVDQILAIANSTTYGGAGYAPQSLGTLSGGNSAAVDLALHEFGHSFANLADEYSVGSSTTYTGGEPAQVNVSIRDADGLAAEQLKWYRWLDEPGVGAFEGALNSQSGIYRPLANSLMRNLAFGFGPVNSEQFVFKIYESVNPIDSATAAGIYDGEASFFVDPVDPVGRSLDVSWWIDGLLIDGETASSFDVSALNLAPGEYTISTQVVDNTPLVRDETKRAELMTEEMSWTVVVEEAAVVDPILAVGSVEAVAGGMVSVPISLDQLEGVRAIDLTFQYDTTVIDVAPEDVSLGNLTSDWGSAVLVDDAAGLIVVELFDDGPNPAGAGEVLRIDLHVAADAPLGDYPLTLIDSELNDVPVQQEAGALRVVAPLPHIVSATAGNSVVDLTLSFDPVLDQLNLYDGPDASIDLPDVTLVGDATGPIAGSLVWNPVGSRLRFVKTGGPFAADSYTLTIPAQDDGLASLDGQPFDGDRDQIPGGDFRFEFDVATTIAPTLSVPDFVRGPNQTVLVPNDAPQGGLPVRIDDADGLQSIDITLGFDPELLNVSNVRLPSELVTAGWQIDSLDLSVPGEVRITASSATPLDPGAAELLLIDADVPTNAPRGAAHVVQFLAATLNGGNLAVESDSAIHTVAFLGDATADGNYSALDASLIARIAVLLDNGFDGYPRIDPSLVGDATGNGDLSSLDASHVARKAIRLPQDNIPDLPTPQAAPAESPVVGQFFAPTEVLAIAPTEEELLRTDSLARAADATLSRFNLIVGPNDKLLASLSTAPSLWHTQVRELAFAQENVEGMDEVGDWLDIIAADVHASNA